MKNKIIKILKNVIKNFYKMFGMLKMIKLIFGMIHAKLIY